MVVTFYSLYCQSICWLTDSGSLQWQRISVISNREWSFHSQKWHLLSYKQDFLGLFTTSYHYLDSGSSGALFSIVTILALHSILFWCFQYSFPKVTQSSLTTIYFFIFWFCDFQAFLSACSVTCMIDGS